MRSSIAVLLILLVTGCSPAARLARIYERHPEFVPQASVTYDTIIWDTVVYRDTTVYINLPADTILVTGDVVYIPKEKIVKVEPERLTAENDYARATAWIDSLELKLELIAKDTTLVFRLDSALREAKYWEQVYKETKIVHTSPLRPEFRRFLLKLTLYIIGGLIVLFTIKRLFKRN